MESPAALRSATVAPPSGNIWYSPDMGPLRIPEVSGNMMIFSPSRAARRLTSSMSAGSTQPGMMFMRPFFLPVVSARRTMPLTMLENPVTWEPT